MTTFEHAMVGVCGAFAAGLHNRFGWRIAALAGAAAITPDWDGLTLLFGANVFADSHRIWGHNLIVCAAIGLLLAALDYHFDLAGKFYVRLLRLFRNPLPNAAVLARRDPSLVAWLAVGMLAALSHLPADLIYSGGRGLTDWELQLLWPFSSRGFIYPLVRWGDVGATLIFVASLAVLVHWPRHKQALGIASLIAVMAYIAIRGSIPIG